MKRGGGWRSCSVLPQPHRSPPALPTQALVRPQPEGEAGGQGKGGGRGSLRAADPPLESSWEPLAGARGVRALWGRAMGPRGAGTSRDVLLGAARGGVQVLVLWGERCPPGWTRGCAVGQGGLRWLRGTAPAFLPHGAGAGSQRAASWAGQDLSRALGKGGRGLRGPVVATLGVRTGAPSERVGAQRGRGGCRSLVPVLAQSPQPRATFKTVKKFYFFVYCIAVSTGFNFLQNKRL